MSAMTTRSASEHRDGPAAQQVLTRIAPVLAHVGVTRLADITWLDDLGIPCWQAVRPASRTLSVSQGKGVTPVLGALSAAMEAIEVWHAENLADGPVRAPVGEVAGRLGYPVGALRVAHPSTLNRGTVLDWTPARSLCDGRPSLVPTALLRMDSTVDGGWEPPRFVTTSNGLASGTTREKAVRHGLYEVIERDALARTEPVDRPRLDLSALTGPAEWLLSRFHGAGVKVAVERADSPVGIACLVVRAWSADFPADFVGSGAHWDPYVALCTALAEAAQSRMAAVAGTREDLDHTLYGGEDLPAPGEPVGTVGLGAAEGPEPGVTELARRVAGVSGHPPLVVEHTRPELAVPVVRVVCPGMLCPADY